MTYLKVYDNTSKHERTVTQKAFDIITKNRRNPRYKFLSYVDESGQQIEGDAPEPEKKTQVSPELSQEKSVAPAADELTEGITIIRKKPGPKPKVNAQE